MKKKKKKKKQISDVLVDIKHLRFENYKHVALSTFVDAIFVAVVVVVSFAFVFAVSLHAFKLQNDD